MVDAEDIAEVQRYVEIWRKTFGEILGWTAQQTDEWAKVFTTGSLYLTLHEDPCFWMINRLVPEGWPQRFPRVDELFTLALKGGFSSPWSPTDEELDNGIKRLKAVIDVASRFPDEYYADWEVIYQQHMKRVQEMYALLADKYKDNLHSPAHVEERRAGLERLGAQISAESTELGDKYRNCMIEVDDTEEVNDEADQPTSDQSI